MEWNDKLAVGIKTIDSQHRELFKRINNLVAAIKEHRCKTEIEVTLKFIGDSARADFDEA